MSPSLSTSLQVVMALDTSESPSPSRSSPLTSCESEIRVTEGAEAIAPKLAAVRKVSSLTMSKPRRPGLATVPTILSLM
jgi:hypothetical protein